MAGGPTTRVSAASARAHTRKAQQRSFPSGIFKKLALVSLIGIIAWAYKAIQPPHASSNMLFLSYIKFLNLTKVSQGYTISGIFKKLALVSLIGIIAWAYKAIQPPQPRIPGSPGGPPITAPRVKLRDGRHLAYKEHGVPKHEANYKIIYLHAFDSCRHDAVIAKSLSQKIVDDLGIYIVSFDRPGYGESDPDPGRTMKSMALDIEDLADQLELGPKFYVIGFSMGAKIVWSCLKYIPHRLLGASLLAPGINFWWPSLPKNLSSQAFSEKSQRDQWVFRVAHYTPWLTYWWNTQKLFPVSSAIVRTPDILCPSDRELAAKRPSRRGYEAQVRQQGEFESLHRDMIVSFGTWEFEPMGLESPFPNNEGYVHLWQGDEDKLVSIAVQRFIADRLPWIHYHEIPHAGHLFPFADGMADEIVKVLLGAATA